MGAAGPAPHYVTWFTTFAKANVPIFGHANAPTEIAEVDTLVQKRAR